MSVPQPKFRYQFPVNKGKGAKKRKYMSDKIVPDSMVVKTCHFNCGPFVKNGDAQPAFAGYKFTRKQYRTNPSTEELELTGNLEWNDGVFWCYQNNFQQLPMAAATYGGALGTTANEMNQHGCMSNWMQGNRSLYGGSLVLQSQDPDWLASNIDIPSSTQSAIHPIVCLRNTANIHQVSQEIKLKEDMVYTGLRGGASGALTGYCMFPQIELQDDLLTATAFNSNERITAQMKLQKAFQFKVRNIVLLVPHNLTRDEASEQVWYGKDMDNIPNGTAYLEENLMKELFQKTDRGFGPPMGDQSDLKRRVNPDYVVYRDWVQHYGWGSDGVSSCKYTNFKHNYNPNNPTMCRTEDTFGDIVQPANATGEDVDMSGENDFSQRLAAEAPSLQSASGPSTNDPSYVRAGVVERGENKRARVATDAASIQQPEATDFQREYGGGVTQNLPRVYNPQTHRLVWIRLPRFGSNLELDDLNDDTVRLTQAITSRNNYLGILENCGLRVRGYSQWKMLKPEVTNTGGVSCYLPFEASGASPSWIPNNFTFE